MSPSAERERLASIRALAASWSTTTSELSVVRGMQQTLARIRDLADEALNAPAAESPEASACAFGPQGEHDDDPDPVRCEVCDRPTCDYCGVRDYEGDWLCPDHAPDPPAVPVGGDGQTVIYDGASGEPRALGVCMRGHVYTMPITSRGCPVCDAPNRLKRELNTLVEALPEGDGGMTCSEWLANRNAAREAMGGDGLVETPRSRRLTDEDIVGEPDYEVEPQHPRRAPRPLTPDGLVELLTSDEAVEALARATLGRDAERWRAGGATERLVSFDDLTPQARADRRAAARHDLEAVAARLSSTEQEAPDDVV